MKNNVQMDCRYFKSDIPCKWHKQTGQKCVPCAHYEKITKKYLIIKLGAAGDVIRTTPLITKIKGDDPGALIIWLTQYPKLVPNMVDIVLNYDLDSVLWLERNSFDFLLNLDKDRCAIALASKIKAKVKYGFIQKDGKCYPANKSAVSKWHTGIWDDANRTNKKSYPEEIFEICGYKYNKEKYILPKPEDCEFPLNKAKKVVGLNTGCGARWQTRLWPERYWIELARGLKKNGCEVVALGGEAEHEKNRNIAKAAKIKYFGTFPLSKFTSLMDKCDLIVTSVSMAMHIAIGLEKKIVLFNNIFNKNEFELYGLGKIVEPDIPCKGCFKTECETDCMKKIKPGEVLTTCLALLNS